jgi:hypothetical protein
MSSPTQDREADEVPLIRLVDFARGPARRPGPGLHVAVALLRKA